MKPAVLRETLFVNLEVRKDFDARHDGGVNDFWHDQGTVQHAVHAIPDAQIVFLRFDMNIRSARSDGVADKDCHDPGNWRLRGDIFCRVNGLLVFLLGDDRSLFLLHHLKRFPDFRGDGTALPERVLVTAFRRQIQLDMILVLLRQKFQSFQRLQIRRVGKRYFEHAAGFGERHERIIFERLLRNQRQRLLRQRLISQIHVRDAKKPALARVSFSSSKRFKEISASSSVPLILACSWRACKRSFEVASFSSSRYCSKVRGALLFALPPVVPITDSGGETVAVSILVIETNQSYPVPPESAPGVPARPGPGIFRSPGSPCRFYSQTGAAAMKGSGEHSRTAAGPRARNGS